MIAGYILPCPRDTLGLLPCIPLCVRWPRCDGFTRALRHQLDEQVRYSPPAQNYACPGCGTRVSLPEFCAGCCAKRDRRADLF
jgi:hypothetical protein